MRDPHVIDTPHAEWSQAVTDFSDFNFEQSSDYTLAMAEKTGSIARFLLVKDAGRVIGAAAVRINALPLIGRGVAYISGGPLVCLRGTETSHRDEVLLSLRRKLVGEEGHALYIRLPLAMEAAEAGPIDMPEAGNPSHRKSSIIHHHPHRHREGRRKAQGGSRRKMAHRSAVCRKGRAVD